MARFQFRLATLMKLRKEARNLRRTELNRAQEAAATLAERRADVDSRIAQLASQVRGAVGPGTIDLEPMIQAQRYQAVLQAERHALDDQAAVVAEEVQRRHTAVVAADREVRILEKLHDRQAARHREEELKEETRQLDEAAARPQRQPIGGPQL
jgi:flagellar export protein FliJ